MAVKVLGISYVTSFNIMAFEVVTLVDNSPSVFHTGMHCDTYFMIWNDQSITAPVSDGWPEEIAFLSIVFVDRTSSTWSGRWY